MAAKQICVSSFHFVDKTFLDVATLSVLARQTGGQVYLYHEATGPMRDVWATKLEAELGRYAPRTCPLTPLPHAHILPSCSAPPLAHRHVCVLSRAATSAAPSGTRA